MILSFKTKINGKPTFFVERIQKGLRDILDIGLNTQTHYPNCYNFFVKDRCVPKIHTIRRDEKGRWKAGNQIDFFINARTKNMFRFAPQVSVVSTQRIFITYLPHLGNGFEVSIDGKYLSKPEIESLSTNDGFDSVTEFEDYFISEMIENEFSGKIIHWTNYSY